MKNKMNINYNNDFMLKSYAEYIDNKEQLKVLMEKEKKKKKKYKIKISFLTKDQIINLSFGEILNSKTLNFKNFKPEPEGLFCSSIFGPVESYKCYCEKKYAYDYLTDICKNCKVEAILNVSRRERFAFLDLGSSFLNPLFFKSNPYYLSTILNLNICDLFNILYNNFYVVIYSSIDELKFKDVINLKKYLYYNKKYKNFFYADTGFSAILDLLNFIDLNYEVKKLKKFFSFKKNFFNNLNKKKLKRYKIIKSFFNSKSSLCNILINNILILPPDLRPILRLPDNTIVSSDLNELYRRVINRSNRLKNFVDLYNISPSILIKNEKRILQKSIEELFLGGGVSNKKSLKSISENLKGKTGYFRYNLLGKRVDYSGRSVIVSGPNLSYGECSIPKDMAIELFRPFLYNKLLLIDKDYNIKMARSEVDRKTNLVVKILYDIIKNTYIILNRAPTLHRLNIQSFKVSLTNDKAIKLHPLVCAAYNADFDGDQMAVHIPLSERSRVEYKGLLSSENNILYPSNGTCCILPTKDIILGIYYSTKYLKNFFINNKLFFNSFYEVNLAYQYSYINLNSVIYIRYKTFNNNSLSYNIYKTNFGRFLIFNVFKFLNIPYDLFNKTINKSNISKILNFLSLKHGFNGIYNLSDNLMRLGFDFSTISGISISIDDMCNFINKKKILNKIKNLYISYNIDFVKFFLTKNSKKRKIINIWEISCELISNLAVENLFFSNYLDNNNISIKYESLNSLFLMIDSGARGSETQVKQICGSRGLISYKKTGLLNVAVFSSLRDGLNVLEYFYFTHNSRKTLADTALKTSSAGYLTRRLVESVNNIVILEEDCFTNRSIILKSLIYEGIVIEDLSDRIFGRILSSNIYDKNNNIIISKNTMLTEFHSSLIKKMNINFINVRSSLTCESKSGICCMCYGIDLSRNKIVNIGEVIGIIAAQSIGEPGTQLTMRTFHTGGYISRISKNSFFKSNNNGYLKYSSSLKYIENSENFKIVISKISKIFIFDNFNRELESFNIPYSSILFIENNSKVSVGDLICKWNPNYDLIISEFSGFIIFKDFLENLNFIRRNDSENIEIKNYKIMPSISICEDKNFDNCILNFKLLQNYLIPFNDNDFINKGDIIIKIPKDLAISEDIVGGLPKINNFFEARPPKNQCLISPVNGVIQFSFIRKKKCLNILSLKDKKVIYSSFVDEDKILVFDDQIVCKGDILSYGDVNCNDYLNIHGKIMLINYLLIEIKNIYFSQGVKINDKHIELIIKQMLKYVLIINPGSYNKYSVGDIVLLDSVIKINNEIIFKNKKIIKYKLILLGITKCSLLCDSFLSAAAFQQTNTILSDATVNCKEDNIKSLKTNIMLGNVITAGTGCYKKILKF